MQSVSGVIGVLATEQTLASASYQKLKTGYSSKVRIEERACPDFVSIVEALDHESEAAVAKAEQYIRPLLEAGCDQLTHFSFLKPVINKVVVNKAVVIDTAIAVAREVQRRLNHLGLSKSSKAGSNVQFWTSGEIENTTTSIQNLWGHEVDGVHKVVSLSGTALSK